MAIAESLDLHRADLSPELVAKIRKVFTKGSVDYRNLEVINRFVDRFGLADGFFAPEEIAGIGRWAAFSFERNSEDIRTDIFLWRYLTFGA